MFSYSTYFYKVERGSHQADKDKISIRGKWEEEEEEAFEGQLIESAINGINFTDNLYSLILININIAAKCAAFISESLPHSPNSRELDLSFNPLHSNGVSHLAENLHHVPQLTELVLWDVQMGEKECTVIAASLKYLNKLEELNIHDNALGHGIIELAKSLNNVPNLTNLGLKNTNMGEDEASALALALKNEPDDEDEDDEDNDDVDGDEQKEEDNDDEDDDCDKNYDDDDDDDDDEQDLFAAARDMKMEWLVVKGVCDFARGSRSTNHSWKTFACVMAASVVSNMLSNSLVFGDWPHYGDFLQSEMNPTEVERSAAKRIKIEDHRKPDGITKETLEDCSEVFGSDEHYPNRRRILVYGRPGIVKSTFTQKLAVDWADGKKEILRKFVLALLIKLRDVCDIPDLCTMLKTAELLSADGPMSVDVSQ
ncbi:Protein NLRC5 [Stylophora pistillata]|uniref:Protein NLRC5 n=1 Tax=Stylophora pistillata TaxID=50429 RepID=A0A2B4RCW1_STYPI|nr:Protein NLRC5 [Stylophora pistillata]